MKRILISCLVILFVELSANSATTFFPPLQPAGQNQLPTEILRDYTTSGNNVVQNPVSSFSQVSYPKVTSVEKSLFGRAFVEQDLLVRLSRIEKSLFRKTFPSASPSQRVENIILNFNQINEHTNIPSNVLSGMESRIFNSSFPQMSATNRIERLEQKVFGAVQGGEINDRYLALRTAVKNYNSNINSNPFAYNSDPSTGGWKNILSNIGSAFIGGSMTGFTPPISPYNNSYDNYSYNPYNSGSGIYRGSRTNTGYHDDFSNYGSQSRVTILD